MKVTHCGSRRPAARAGQDDVPFAHAVEVAGIEPAQPVAAEGAEREPRICRRDRVAAARRPGANVAWRATNGTSTTSRERLEPAVKRQAPCRRTPAR